MRKIFFLISLILLLSNFSFGQFAKIRDFASLASGVKADGVQPDESLISDGIFLYGTTQGGGLYSFGIIFKIKPDGTGFVKLHDFKLDEGVYPESSLMYDGAFLYGMTSSGGTLAGTVFKLKPDGTGFEILHDFAGGSDGNSPSGNFVFDGTFLYGMTSSGGNTYDGTIFKIKRDGTGYVKLLDFPGGVNGHQPFGSLILNGNFLYGMTDGGGTNGMGIIFKIKTDGTGFIKLLDFSGANGASPQSNLVFDGDFLYGMTINGGANELGVIFKIKTDGTGYQNLHEFSGPDGATPLGSLIVVGDFLYGTASVGGTNNMGTIFRIKKNGEDYEKLFDFGEPDGYLPIGALLLQGDFLYGMTNMGGIYGGGIIFKYQYDSTATTGTVNYEIEIPNLITPNGDAKNEWFTIKNVKGIIRLEVYNRWGEKIFESEDYKNNWGSSNLSDGIYCYYLKNEYGQAWKGWVQVIK